MPTDLTKIDITKIDSNLFKGTPDRLADNLGYTYQFTDNQDGLNQIELTTPVVTTDAGSLNEITAHELRDNKIKYLQCQLKDIAHGDSLIHGHRFAVRITGDPESYNDDRHWLTSLVGGLYANETLEPLISQGIFDVYGHQYQATYDAVEGKEIRLYSQNNQPTTTHEVGYRYNLYLPRYQDHITKLQETELPNIYFNELYSLSAETTSPEYNLGERPNIEKFVSRENPDYRDVHASKGSQRTESPPPYDITNTDRGTDGSGDGYYFDKSLYLRQYLTGTFINSALSASVTANIINKSQTIFFTSGAVKDIFERIYEGQDDSMVDRYPMYNRIVIPHIDPRYKIYLGNQTDTDSFTQIIAKNNLQEEVMQYINDTFDTGVIENIEFVTQTDKLVVSEGQVKNSIEAKTKSNAAIDLPKMLLDIASNNMYSESGNELFLTPKTDEAVAMINTAGALRYYKSINGTKALEETIAVLNNRNHQPYSVENDTVQYNGTDSSINFANMLDALRSSTDSREPEILAYKVEKFVGSPVGKNASSRKLQTYMFFNTPDLDPAGTNEFVFHDTQVKYRQEYSYIVKAYAVIQGYNYEYSDLRVSRQIGDVFYRDPDGNIIDTPSDNEKYCLEFFNPTTQEASEQLLNEETNLLTGRLTPATLTSWDLDLIIWALGSGEWTKIFEYPGAMSPEGLAYADKLITEFDIPTSTYDPESDFHSVWDAIDDAGRTFGGAGRGATAFGDPILRDLAGHIVQEHYEKWAIEQRTHLLRLAWYDPAIAIAALMDTTGLNSGDEVWLGSYSDQNQYATNAQIKAANKYLADLHFDIEPSVKIIEIPIMAKAVSIRDHPPVACDVVPYQRKDNSNVIGFYINKEAFTDSGAQQFRISNSKLGLYPTPMAPHETEAKKLYLSSNNIIESEIIKNKSVSHLINVNVFRIDFRPTSIEDFADHYITKVNLSYGEAANFGLSNGFYEERISTNQKYYYLFKFTNANGHTGYISPIQVVELVDDGGYKYATFDLLFENDLETPPETQSSIQFKKLMQISLNSQHTQVNYENANFNETATDSLELVEVGPSNSDESIWDKKFKFRLTSKKTGKKIDLNITYKLRTD